MDANIELTGNSATVIFDQKSNCWQEKAAYNLMFLQCQQNYANDLLQARGHVFLNEIYGMLGLDRTQDGVITGWLSDGDRISFSGEGEFIVKADGSIPLQFNVDGIIYDKI